MWIFPMRERGDCQYVKDVTRGFDPKSLNILETDGEYILSSDVACIDGVTTTVWKFDLIQKLLIPKKE